MRDLSEIIDSFTVPAGLNQPFLTGKEILLAFNGFESRRIVDRVEGDATHSTVYLRPMVGNFERYFDSHGDLRAEFEP
jgi:hypothetical protein